MNATETTIASAATTTVDPSAIVAATVAHMEQAWNAADGAAFGEVFADDSDFVDIRGTHHRGVADIAHGHQAIFDSIYAGSTVRYELEGARQVAPGCIVALATAPSTRRTARCRG